MLEFLKKELMLLGIEDVSTVPLSLCQITRDYKLEKCGFTDFSLLSVIIFTIPYYTEQQSKNVSSYAVARDYHLFCARLFDNILPKLRVNYPNNTFAGFSDNSPIDERHAAALSGLGIIGRNGMLITKRYSSYVFLAEIITDLQLNTGADFKITYCDDCGRCSAACPKSECGECLSALSQKKGKLTLDEQNLIRKYGSAWGCDICQEVCPHTEIARRNKTLCTPIPFFKNELIPIVTQDIINNMSDEDFRSRAYSWRRRETILRNLKILEK